MFDLMIWATLYTFLLNSSSLDEGLECSKNNRLSSSEVNSTQRHKMMTACFSSSRATIA